MKRKFFIVLFLLIFIYGFAEGNQNILVLQSMAIKPYEEVLQGFKQVCPCSTKKLVVSELNGLNIISLIREIKPDIILTIGTDALLRVKEIKNVPVIYLMVLNPESIVSPEKENITGVSMRIPAVKQLATLQKLMPGIKKIGLLFDPEKTGLFVKAAQRASEKLGLELIAEKAYNPRQVPSLIAAKDLKNTIDAFWMLPDTSIICPETVEFLLLFSVEYKIPIISFADKYVEMGALMSLNIDAIKLGEQAGRMAVKILSSHDRKNFSRAKAEDMTLTINLKAAENLGIQFNNKVVENWNIATKNGEIINKTRITY